MIWGVPQRQQHRCSPSGASSRRLILQGPEVFKWKRKFSLDSAEVKSTHTEKPNSKLQVSMLWMFSNPRYQVRGSSWNLPMSLQKMNSSVTTKNYLAFLSSLSWKSGMVHWWFQWKISKEIDSPALLPKSKITEKHLQSHSLQSWTGKTALLWSHGFIKETKKKYIFNASELEQGKILAKQGHSGAFSETSRFRYPLKFSAV